MKICVFAVRDLQLEEFMGPFVAVNRAMGERAFADEVRNPNSPAARHPDSFALYELGTWNTSTGQFESGEPFLVGFARGYLVDANS